MPADQHAVAVDAVGRAGDECAEILSLFNFQVVQGFREHDPDLVDLVGVGLVQDGEREGITLCHLAQIRKKLCAGKTAVAGKRTVAPRASDRKTRLFQVSDGDLQDLLVRTVIQREFDVDLRNVDISHDAGSREIQKAQVFFSLFLGHVPLDPCLGKTVIIVFSGADRLRVLRRVQVRHALHIACDHS